MDSEEETTVQEEPTPEPLSSTFSAPVVPDARNEADRMIEDQKKRKLEKETEELREYEEMRRSEREREESEIKALREKKERRKVERVEEEQRLNEMRAVEDAKRKAEDEERRKAKEAEKLIKQQEREVKVREAEKLRNPPKPNFVITRKATGEGGETTQDDQVKSKEQLEEERKAILSQRITPLAVDGFSPEQLAGKAKELYDQIYRLEAEKYDLEERFKRQQYDMMELAERARQMNKGGKGKGGSARIAESEGGSEDVSGKFSGAPPKITMFSKYERQKDKRDFVERKVIFKGPTWAPEVERIAPQGPIPTFGEEDDSEDEDEAAPAPAPAAEPVAAEGE